MNFVRQLSRLGTTARLVQQVGIASCRPVTSLLASFQATAPALTYARPLVCASANTSALFRHGNSFQSNVRFYSSGLPPHREIGMPALSPTMTHGNISKWLKKEGDVINPGDLICEVETDKATLAFECQEEGYLAKIVMPEGSQQVPINKTVCILVENKGDVEKFASYVHGKAAAAPVAPAAAPAAAAPSSAPVASSVSAPAASVSDSGRVFASPIARKVASENNVDLKAVSPTGPNNRVILADVQSHIANKPVTAAAPQVAAQPAPVSVPPTSSGTYEDITHTNVRRVIASRLQQSKQTVPHFYLTVDCRVDKLFSFCIKFNE